MGAQLLPGTGSESWLLWQACPWLYVAWLPTEDQVVRQALVGADVLSRVGVDDGHPGVRQRSIWPERTAALGRLQLQ